MTIEEMLEKDAANVPNAPEDARIAAALLKPYFAIAAIEAKRRQKSRRERRIFLLALIPFAIFIFFTASALLKGRLEQAHALLVPFGALSIITLMTLPLLERFLPRHHHG